MTAPVFVEYLILSTIVGDVFQKLNVIMKVYKELLFLGNFKTSLPF